mmetsp:Transcript_10612/g.25391  ORF Transcript_10612/g.25391 Transcript_10612/m.25391 type:complete len:217 (-) Transcript_10612:70-720(-)
MGGGESKPSLSMLQKTHMNLKLTAKQMEREAKRSEKEAKKQKKKAAAAMKKGNLETARTYAQNAIMQQSEATRLVKLGCQLEAVALKVNNAVRTQHIAASMGQVVKGINMALAATSADQMSRIMTDFAEKSEDMEVRAAFMSGQIDTASASAMPAQSVDGMLREVATENEIELSGELAEVGTGVPGGVAVAGAGRAEEKPVDDFASRLAALGDPPS